MATEAANKEWVVRDRPGIVEAGQLHPIVLPTSKRDPLIALAQPLFLAWHHSPLQLASRPEGFVSEDNFRMQDCAMPEPQEGEVLVSLPWLVRVLHGHQHVPVRDRHSLCCCVPHRGLALHCRCG
jgi:hypothetical protein